VAQGSHATLGGWEPARCALCGDRVRVSKDSAWYHHGTRAVSVHRGCWERDPGRVRELIR
jgi:hypothetical protein